MLFDFIPVAIRDSLVWVFLAGIFLNFLPLIYAEHKKNKRMERIWLVILLLNIGAGALFSQENKRIKEVAASARCEQAGGILYQREASKHCFDPADKLEF